ncbi:MAG: hypothetical protein GWM87_07825 [Xanthomonadales bacterium]|nr:hypothetical protein [Xanthomonadales bacterium]NIX12852.1 hypothetical protein [Xanthomonadales bacterium]
MATVILAAGLAGLASLLIKSIGGTGQAENHTAASLLADSLATTIRLSRGHEAMFLSDVTSAPDCSHITCAPDQFAAYSLAQWQDSVASSLPDGKGVTCMDGSPEDGTAASPECDGVGTLAIKVFWRAPLLQGPTAQRHAITVFP